MKLIFLSNYYTHHQSPICEALYRLTNGAFSFVSTQTMSEERRQLGWRDEKDVPFVQTDAQSGLAAQIAAADGVILGDAPMSIVEDRLKQEKVVFKYSERVFKRGYSSVKWLPRLWTYWRNYGRFSQLYLLAAGAYVTRDFAIHGTFLGKSYRWGYFTQTEHYDVDALLDGKTPNRILWCGRFLDWKHPEAALEVAARLKGQDYVFELDVIGAGELGSYLQQRIQEKGLESCIRLLGTMSPQQVRRQMEQASIFLFTSDFQEGWGAVLNEAMNSGCAVVASHAIGAVPFLLEHGENGLIYENGDMEDLYRKVKALLDHPDHRRRLGTAAYRTITELWNEETAAQRLLCFAEEIKTKGACDLYANGPCSRASSLRNDWFRKERYGLSWIAQ